jgi:hypothetical protein
VKSRQEPRLFTTKITPQAADGGLSLASDFDIGRQDRVKVAAGWVIRRWQPGQSDEGGLLPGGQYTNLSVRQ